MDLQRIKEIQASTSHPNSVSVQQALMQVWRECEQRNETKGFLETMLYMSEERGVEGCYWGDTDRSSTDVAFGYNMALQDVKDRITNYLNKSEKI